MKSEKLRAQEKKEGQNIRASTKHLVAQRDAGACRLSGPGVEQDRETGGAARLRAGTFPIFSICGKGFLPTIGKICPWGSRNK